MTDHDYSRYADSAQAREADERMAARFNPRLDRWGNPIVADVFDHDYEAANKREAEERKSRSARIQRAMGQMETLLGITPTAQGLSDAI